MSKVAEVDSNDISTEEFGELKEMVDNALAQAIPESPPGMPDEEQYYLEIEIDQRRTTIFVTRSSIPDPVRPLIEFMGKLAEYEKR